MGFPPIRRIFGGEEGVGGDGGRTRGNKPAYRKAFDSCKLSAYIWLVASPENPNGAPPLDPAGGSPPDSLFPP